MVLVIYFSARTWEGFGKAVEEGAVGGGRKWMSLLTLQESSENTECGAEVEETNRKNCRKPKSIRHKSILQSSARQVLQDV